MKIKVTKENIINGKRFEPRFCPIALAIKQCGIDRRLSVHVCQGSKMILISGLSIPMDADAVNFANKFDLAGGGKPFTFDLDVPGWALKNK